MSMGGAEATAPPILFLVIYSQECRATGRQKLRSVSYKSSDLLEYLREKTLPCRAFVRHSDPLRSARDLLLSPSARRDGSFGRFTGQKEKEIQAQKKQNDPEGPPRQSQTKARLALIIRWRTPFS